MLLIVCLTRISASVLVDLPKSDLHISNAITFFMNDLFLRGARMPVFLDPGPGN